MINYADVIAALGTLSAFLLFFYGPWQSAMTDIARQVVFEERDAVFDMAAEGKLAFDSKEYKVIRDSFNDLIRFAHELTWVRLVVHWRGQKEIPDVQLALERIGDAGVRAEVTRHLRRARYAMFGMMGLKSLPLTIAVLVVVAISWCMGRTRDLFRRVDSVCGQKMLIEAEGA
jgi:hypothetical protein